LDYGVLADGVSVDWSRRVAVTCNLCGSKHDMTSSDVVALNIEQTCARCGPLTPSPASASRVQYGSCGLINFGPAAQDAARRDEVAIIEGLHGMELRAAVEDARPRAARPQGEV
jgi:hypothetical protein